MPLRRVWTQITTSDSAPSLALEPPLNGLSKFRPIGRVCSREDSLPEEWAVTAQPHSVSLPMAAPAFTASCSRETLKKECSSGLLGQQQKLSKTRILENSRFHSTFYVNYKLASSWDGLSIIPFEDMATNFRPFAFFPSLEIFEQLF